jgi:hypothetical protein
MKIWTLSILAIFFTLSGVGQTTGTGTGSSAGTQSPIINKQLRNRHITEYILLLHYDATAEFMQQMRGITG